ncbi:polysaccharide pyruvyl transferase family protein [Kineococcus sp. GCM10028916]|uniref:polysaccharide pyruvyl transferase family protein n=1 Tax=Kineococcus sp. GCM10028916 TaxID=3273394 RepID=UPI00362D7D93
MVSYVDAHTQFDNLGDDVILERLLALLAERGEVVVDTRGIGPELLELTGAGNHRRAGALPLRILADAARDRLRAEGSRSRRVLVLKPGHIGGTPSARAIAERVVLLGVTLGCRALGARVVRTAFSVADLHPTMLLLERWQTRAMHVYAPRDSRSVRYARGKGLRVHATSADLAWTVPVTPVRPRTSPGTVVFSLRCSTSGYEKQDDYERRLTALVGRLQPSLRSGGRTPVWVSQVVSDDAFAGQLADGPGERVVFDRTPAGSRRVLDAYAGAEVVLTNRLHTFLLALAQGTPALVLTDPSTHAKLDGLLSDAGLGDLLLDVRSVSADDVLARIDGLTAELPDVATAVAKAFATGRAHIAATLDDAVAG